MILREAITCIVLAHGGAADCVARHMPLWQKAAAEVVVFSPQDDPLPPGGLWSSLHFGFSSRYGAANNARVLAALRFAQCCPTPLTLLCEYDAVTWGPIPEAARPPIGGLSGARFTEPREHAGIRFEGSQYFHFPMLIDSAGVDTLVDEIGRLPADAEGGYADRVIGLAAERGRMPYVDLFSLGLAFTRDSIDGRKIELCRKAVGLGARFSHGIKTAEALNRIMEVSPWK